MSALPYSLSEIEQALAAQFPQSQLQVIDESAAHAGHSGNPDGDAISHIRVQLKSPSFASLKRVAQHRAVHAALQNFYDQGLHAVVLETAAL